MNIQNDMNKHRMPTCGECGSNNVQLMVYLQFENGEPYRVNDVANDKFGYCCESECSTYSHETSIDWVKTN